MNKITSIIPDILFFRFSNDLWHILRAHGFGVAIQNGCSAIISVDESILCTMDVLGRITPDETFREKITTDSRNGQVELMYDIPATLRTILGLTNADAHVIEGSTLFFTSDTLNDALADLLSNNTEGKDKLEAWAAQNHLTAMPETDDTGTTSASNLELGLYIVRSSL